MVHIYAGDGKGKTTAACGLAVRAAGRGVPVVFAQFLKDGSSGEISVLREIRGIRVLVPERTFGFVSGMPDAEKRMTAEECGALFRRAAEQTEELLEEHVPGAGKNAAAIRVLLVLDEVLHAVRYGFIEREALMAFLRRMPPDAEIVLTGRGIPAEIGAEADYITEMKKEKHPFDRDVPARSGVEF